MIVTYWPYLLTVVVLAAVLAIVARSIHHSKQVPPPQRAEDLREWLDRVKGSPSNAVPAPAPPLASSSA
ncbi:hypothetical protein [[Mycobacterium] nativiensis]|uniref:Uncharacterized protein n=1 Tax=[Mycobacterium] nativiensis TaxID=2855503 RepID=A0ABU5Y4F5_9MYCO|nr:hypothetical protein [Mycolicibacter sp. MYC340]MEB3034566.1 hypothetical protein [Mycolicibacter sp. MYC340]